MVLFSKQVTTEPCGLSVNAQMINWEMWRWVEEAARHTNLRKTKFRKGCFSELWKAESILVYKVKFHVTVLRPTVQERKKGNTGTSVSTVIYLFLTHSELKFQIQVSLELKSWQTLRASWKAKLHLLELALSQRWQDLPLSGWQTYWELHKPISRPAGLKYRFGMELQECVEKPGMEQAGLARPLIPLLFITLLVKLTIRLIFQASNGEWDRNFHWLLATLTTSPQVADAFCVWLLELQ